MACPAVCCLHSTVGVEFVQRVVQPAVELVTLTEPTWGIAPNGHGEIAHEDIARVHLNKSILPPLGVCSPETIVLEEYSRLVGKMRSEAQDGPIGICKEPGALIAMLEHKVVHCVADEESLPIDGP